MMKLAGACAIIFEPSWCGTNVADEEDISDGFAYVAADYASSLTYVTDSHSSHQLKKNDRNTWFQPSCAQR
jgi:hypothetical protein